ncbi:SNF2-related protein [Bifidobacterium saguinibicoloris]|uniref:SNF2-related protein n=1 Tax=Bifidobacterium saguinibicoloris TaxID=2834433 RepID=UPI001C596242|nr:SNF2 helicase associated domain-containing protein [Bifidobacterium saguinibicoloris]
MHMGVSVFGHVPGDFDDVGFDDGPISGFPAFGDGPAEVDPWSDGAWGSGGMRRSGARRGRGGQRPIDRSFMDDLMTDLKYEADAATVSRARVIARRVASMMDSLTYDRDEGGAVTISGRVHGTTSPTSRYTVNVYIGGQDAVVSGGGCTCPAYRRGYVVCKHMAALVIAFAGRPEMFAGFTARPAHASSADLLAVMRAIDEQDEQERDAKRRETIARAGTSDARGGGEARPVVAPGQVELLPTLRRVNGWNVWFRIGAGGGSSYVLKTISGLLDDVRARRYHEYGRKLAFTHTPSMFDERSRRLLSFLGGVEDVRRATDLQDIRYGRFGAVTIDRYLTLADSETARLLDIMDGGRMDLVLDAWYDNSPATVDVGGDAPFAMPLVSMRRINGKQGVDGYALSGEPTVDSVITGDHGAWLLMPPGEKRGATVTRSARSRLTYRNDVHVSAAGYRFVRCPETLEPYADLLPVLCGGTETTIAFDDAPLFARTLLPRMMDSGLLPAGNVPKEIELLRPVECEPEFYLDRDEHGLTCVAKARYGERETVIVPQRGGDFASGVTPMVGAGHDFGAERMIMDLVRAYFTIDAPTAPGRIGRDETTRIVALFDKGLPALRQAGKVFTTPAFDRMLAPKPPTVKVGLSVKSNLVEISPIADEVPPDEVGSLLASYRRRQRFHRLRDGTLVNLEGARLDALDHLADDLDLSEDELNGGAVTLPGMQAFLLDGELAGTDVEKEPSFMAYVDELTHIDPAAYEVPEPLRGVLRPYQEDGYRWLRTLCDKGFGGILADEMGLGKSVQLIALLEGLRSADASLPSLIVCPASLVYNWVAEFAKFAPDIRAVAVAGTKTERRAAIARYAPAGEQGDGGEGDGHDGTDADRDAAPAVLVTSYDLLRRDVDDYAGRRFSVMALDEAQVIKNHTTKIAKAVKTIEADHRIALTGTPIENRLSELWSIFDFLMPGLLGSYKRFHERYELPIANGRAADAASEQGRAAARINPESEQVARRLQALVGVFIKRRLKSQVLTDLPDKIETTITVQLEGEQRKLYAAHEQRLRRQLEHKDDGDFNTSKIQILAELTKLRQICCDPRLLYADAKDRSAKLAAIEELVDSCMSEGKKALVFSQFTSYLELIAARLNQHGIRHYTIDGSTPKKRRLELVDRFNADSTPVFLISLKAGNTGLNLVGASVVIHADPWWNAAAQNQATDRVHRIGQTRDVDVYQIVAKDTIEERILELQHTKSELARQFTDASALAEAAPASIASLTRDDLLGLLT